MGPVTDERKDNQSFTLKHQEKTTLTGSAHTPPRNTIDAGNVPGIGYDDHNQE